MSTTPRRVLSPIHVNVLIFSLTMVAVVALYVCGTQIAALDGLRHASGLVVGRDFVNYWMGGLAVVGGHVERLFDFETYMQALREVFGQDYPVHNWSYPPHYLFAVAPLGLLAYVTAYVLWILVGVAVYAAAVRALRLSIPWVLIVVAVAPPVLINVSYGQNGLLTAALLLAGLGLRDRRPWLAGVLLGILTIKPQLGVLVPFVLVMQQNWRTIAAACLTFVILFIASTVAFGWTPWLAYVSDTVPFQAHVMTEASGVFIAMMPSAFMAGRGLGLDAGSAILLHLPFAAIGMFLVLWTAWSTREADDRIGATAVTIAATFVVAPYVFTYDMAAMTGAVLIWLAAYPERFGPLRGLLAVLALSLPFFSHFVAHGGYPVAPLALLALSAVMTHDVCGGIWPWSRRVAGRHFNPE